MMVSFSSLGTWLSILARRSMPSSFGSTNRAEAAMLKLSAALVITLPLALTAHAAAQTAALKPMPRDLEVRFALSALPGHLREGATVLTLDPAKGYAAAQTGTNGFTCLVARSEWVRGELRADTYVPLCYDAEGSRQHLRVYQDVAQLRAQGWTGARVKAEVEARFQRGEYRAPERVGISYMVAPLMRTYVGPGDAPVATISLPHHMVYAPNLTDRDIGGTPPPSPHPFIFEHGPHGYMVFLVGESERAKLMEASRDLLTALCAFDAVLCLPDSPPRR